MTIRTHSLRLGSIGSASAPRRAGRSPSRAPAHTSRERCAYRPAPALCAAGRRACAGTIAPSRCRCVYQRTLSISGALASLEQLLLEPHRLLCNFALAVVLRLGEHWVNGFRDLHLRALR